MKKTIHIYVLFLLGLTAISQNFSDKEISKLNKLNIQTQHLDLNNTNTQKDLNQILKLNRKHKVNKTIAIVCTSFAAFSGVLGIAGTSSNNGLGKLFGQGFLVLSFIDAGISIPFWVASSKRKKERDKLVKKLLF